ncbi:MAG: FxsA family protein [Actinomycetota bacterium]|nr:FxsA family protein [Actinomycetota bacterium]
MGLLLFVLLLAVPVAELWAILQVADAIGVVPTVLSLIGISVAGAWLLKRQGMATWRNMQASLGRGEMPAKEATDGALILLGGALLLTPGFLTDAVGLLLLLPPTRAALKGVVVRHWKKRVERRWPGTAAMRRVHEARVVKVERNARTNPAASEPDRPPFEPGPSGEGGSRGTR